MMEIKHLVWAQGRNAANERHKRKSKGREQARFYARKFQENHPYPTFILVFLFYFFFDSMNRSKGHQSRAVLQHVRW